MVVFKEFVLNGRKEERALRLFEIGEKSTIIPFATVAGLQLRNFFPSLHHARSVYIFVVVVFLLNRKDLFQMN